MVLGLSRAVPAIMASINPPTQSAFLDFFLYVSQLLGILFVELLNSCELDDNLAAALNRTWLSVGRLLDEKRFGVLQKCRFGGKIAVYCAPNLLYAPSAREGFFFSASLVALSWDRPYLVWCQGHQQL